MVDARPPAAVEAIEYNAPCSIRRLHGRQALENDGTDAAARLWLAWWHRLGRV